jgi:hypothetical protein
MRNCLPMSVQVDPAHRLGRLLTVLRDRALDMAAYEWVSAGQIHEWTGRATGGGPLLASLVAVGSVPRPPRELRAVLADHGVRIEPLYASGAHTAFPVALLTHRGPDGSLTLTAAHDRSRMSGADAVRLVGHCARLLRELPATSAETTLTQVLAVLEGDEPPRIAQRRGSAAQRAARFRLHPIGERADVERIPSGS